MLTTEKRFQKLEIKSREISQQLEYARERLALARSEGDLSENAAYDLAIKDCEMLEKELVELQDQLSNAVIISEVDTSHVSVLCKIVVEDLDGQQRSFIMVSREESGPPNFVSITSLFGKAAEGKCVGDTFTYIDNKFRKQTFKIITIEEAE